MVRWKVAWWLLSTLFVLTAVLNLSPRVSSIPGSLAGTGCWCTSRMSDALIESDWGTG
jgi:hypothetical protein